MPFKPRRSTERELRRRCKQVAKEVARITSTGADATSVVYALEEYAQLLAPWAQDMMLKIVEMSDAQNAIMWRELGAKMAERLHTLYTRDAVAIAIRDLSLEGARFTVEYYDAPDASGEPLRTWEFGTDADGVVRMDAAHLISGDEPYTASGRAGSGGRVEGNIFRFSSKRCI